MDTLLIKQLNLNTQSEVGFERSSFAKFPWEQRLLGVKGEGVLVEQLCFCSTLIKSALFLLKHFIFQ